MGIWNISGSGPGNDRIWLRYIDKDGIRYGLGDLNDGLALMTSQPAWIRDLEGNDQQIRAKEFNARGASGGRKLHGTFNEHPIAANGDVWYVTGDGAPVEGFYGQTKNGPVQFGR